MKPVQLIRRPKLTAKAMAGLVAIAVEAEMALEGLDPGEEQDRVDEVKAGVKYVEALTAWRKARLGEMA